MLRKSTVALLQTVIVLFWSIHATTSMWSIFSFVLYLDPLSSNEASSTDTTYGVVASVIAVLLYGSYFIPVKTVDAGDGEFKFYALNQHLNGLVLKSVVFTGMFFQWICCSAIWFVGLVADTLFHPSRAHPAAMLGGALWATGKSCVWVNKPV